MAVRISNVLGSPLLRTPAGLNCASAGSVSATGVPLYGGQQVNCGPMTADVWKDLLSVESPGILQYLSIIRNAASNYPYTTSLRVFLDEVMVVDSSFGSTYAWNEGMAVGRVSSSDERLYVPFHTLKVQAKISVNATGDGIQLTPTVTYLYWPVQ